MMKLTDNFDKCSGVYIIVNNVNGMVYVGETLNIKRRIKEHYKSKRQLIDKAIHKHGIENFTVDVYYSPNFDKKSLILLEGELIKKFNSVVPNGYNFLVNVITGAYYPVNDTTRQKMSSASGRRNHSDETRKKLSESTTGCKNHFYGKKHTKESKMKISKSTHDRSNSGRPKLVLSKLETDHLINLYLGNNSIRTINEITRLSRRVISNILKDNNVVIMQNRSVVNLTP